MAKFGSRGKIHERCCHGLIASSASQRRTVEADTLTARPSATAWVASSAELHRDSGTARWAGGWHAIALTSATTSAGNERGRPDRLRSFSPTSPSAQYRLRHLLTTPTSTSSRP